MDFFEKYRLYKLKNNLSIIWLSLIFAIFINFFVLNNFDTQNLKTSIIQAEKQENKSDLFFQKQNNNLILKNAYQINNLRNLNFSIVYNPENIEITEIIPKLNSEIQIISNTPGIITVFIDYKDNFTIPANDKIATIKYNKKKQTTENLNIINANFTDNTDNTYSLTTSGITF